MKWIEFADEYEKVLNELIASSERWSEEDREVQEGRECIKNIRAFPKEKSEIEMSKYKTRQVKELLVNVLKNT